MQERIEQSCREDDETLVNDDIFASLSESQMSFSLKENSMIESYQIIKEISRGNMGIVYLAKDTILKRLCAIKIILSHDFNTYTILLKRFKKEAELCAELNHPNIVKIYSVGLYDDHPYIVMEYVEGTTLDNYCQENAENNYTLYAQLFIKIANALYNIHEHNIVHRDIKPSNILVRKNGEPVIMDFGIAKSISKDKTLTQDHQIVGTLHFMSPEQIRGKKLDRRSDIYSLGVMLYYIMTNHFPFEETSTFLIMKNIVSIPPINPNTFNPDIPDILQEVILKSMEKNPANRYETCKDFAKALERYLNKTGKASYTYKTVIKYRSAQKKIEKIQKNLLICLSCIICILCIMLCIKLYPNTTFYANQNNFIESYSIAINNAMKNAIAQKWNALEITPEEYTWQDLLQKNKQYYLEKYYHILAQEYKNNSTEYTKEKEKKYYLKLWHMYENNDFADRLYDFLEEDVKNAIDRDFEKALQVDLSNIDKIDLKNLEENRDKECQKLLENQTEKGLLAIFNNINNTDLENTTIEENQIINPSLEQALLNIMVYLTKAEKWKKDEAIKRKANIYTLIIEKMIESQIIPLATELSNDRKDNKDTKEQEKKMIVLYYINRQYIEYAEKNYYQYWLLHPYNCEIFANILPLLLYHDILEILQNRSIVTITDNEELKEVINAKENNTLALYQKQCYHILQSYTKERKKSLAQVLEQRYNIIERLNKSKINIEAYKRILQIQYRYLLAQFFITQSDEYIAEIYNKSKELKYTTSEEILKNILQDSREELFIRFLAANALNAMQTKEADDTLLEVVKLYPEKKHALSSLLAWIVISHRSDLLEACKVKLEDLYNENKLLYTEESLQLLYQFIDKKQKDLVNNRNVLELLNPKDSYTKLLKIACLLKREEKEQYIDSLISIFDEYYQLIEKNAENQEVQQKMILCLTIMNQYEDNFSYSDFQNQLKKFLQTSDKSSYIPIWEELSEREKQEFLEILMHINKEQFYVIMFRDEVGIPLTSSKKNKEFIINKNILKQIKLNQFTSRLEKLKKLAYSFQNQIQNLSLRIIKETDYRQYRQIALEILQRSEKVSMDTLALTLPEFNSIPDIMIGKNLEPNNFRDLISAKRAFVTLKNFQKFYLNHTIDAKVIMILKSKDDSLLFLKNMLFNRIAFLLNDIKKMNLLLNPFISKIPDYRAEQSGLLSFIVGLGTSQNKEYMKEMKKWYNSKNNHLQRATSFAYTLITEKDQALKVKYNLELKTVPQKQGAYLGYIYNFYTQFKNRQATKEPKFIDNQQAYYIFMNKLYHAMTYSKNSRNNFNISSFEKAQKLGVEVSEETSLQNAITESFLNIMRKENIQKEINKLEALKKKYEQKSSYQAYNYLINKYLYMGYKAISKENIELKNACLKVFPWDKDIRTSEEEHNITRIYYNSNEYNAYIRSHILEYLFNATN